MLSSLKKSFALRLLGVTGIAALVSAVAPTASQADTSKIIEGQALIRWHTYAQSQGLLAPSENKESGVFRQWAASVVTERLSKALKGAVLKQVYPSVGWALIELPEGVQTKAGIAKLQSAFGSGNAAANATVRLSAIPNDSNYSQQWWASKIQAPYAWDASTGSPNVVVAVLDSGSNLSNPDLLPNLWRNPGEIAGDGIDNDGNGYVDDVYGINTVNLPEEGDYERGYAPQDTDGHGTHVAGIIGAAGNNGQGIAGVNWKVKIMTLRFIGRSGYGSTAAVVEAINYVLAMKKKGVNILLTNNSWGGSGKSAPIEDGFKKLTAAKILNICAAGNGTTWTNGANNDFFPNYPSSYNNTGIVAVAATTENDTRAGFSNYGKKSVDLAAPGTNIYSLGLTSDGLTLDGTSMATPMVTGAAALLLSTQSKLSSTQVRAKLLASVDKIPSLTNVVATGGRLNLARVMGQTRVDVTGETFFKGKIGNKSANIYLAGAKVQAIVNKVVYRTTYTNEGGQFSFKELPIGKYTFAATLNGYKFTNKNVTLTEKKAPAKVQLVGALTNKKASTYSISGKAYSATGSLVSGVNIYLNDVTEPIATTDSTGSYFIGYRVEGVYKLTAANNRAVWTPSVPSISLPATSGANVPNGIVNFNALPVDGDAPTVSITSPINGASFTTAPTVAKGNASDITSIETLYFTLERRINAQYTYYNWNTGTWSTDLEEAGTTKAVSQSGKTASWSVTLPSQVAAFYQFKAWGVDTFGNAAPIGGEAVSNWGVGASGNLTSTGSSTSLLSTKRF